MKKICLLSALLFLGIFQQLCAQMPARPGVMERTFPYVDPTLIFPQKDITPPQITCLNSLNVNVLQSDMIQIWSTDLVQAASDNWTPNGSLKFGIREAGTGSGFPLDGSGNPVGSLLFDCDQLGAHMIETWVMDLAGNTNFCVSSLSVQDMGWNCSQNPNGFITVNLQAGNGVEEGLISVDGYDPTGNPFHFFVQPHTAFEVPVGSSGTITPVKDDNPLNGVTTYDLILLKRHYSGVEPLNTPYKIIAGDANRDGILDSQDSTELQKLILGIYQELPNNTSWRFILKDYVFADPQNPLSEAFPEQYVFSNIQQPVVVDFIGIKVGDVNNTAISNGLGSGETNESRNGFIPKGDFLAVSPNPTSGSALISFRLLQSQDIQLRLLDITGKIVWETEKPLAGGENALEIPQSAFPRPGVYFWTLAAPDLKSSGKVIKL